MLPQKANLNKYSWCLIPWRCSCSLPMFLLNFRSLSNFCRFFFGPLKRPPLFHAACASPHAVGTGRRTWHNPYLHGHQTCLEAARSVLLHGCPKGCAHDSSSLVRMHVFLVLAPRRNSLLRGSNISFNTCSTLGTTVALETQRRRSTPVA